MTTTTPRQVWCLWEPKGTLPDYLRLCVATAERNAGVEVTLVDPEAVMDLAPSVDADLAARIPVPGQRSDYYRAHLLFARGGLWLDVDTVVLHDVGWIFDAVDECGLALRPNTIGFGTTPLAAAAGSEVIRRWIEMQEHVIRHLAPGDSLPWTALGSSALTRALAESQHAVLPRSRVAPVSWERSDEFLSRYRRPDSLLDNAVTMVNLYNERFPSRLRHASEEEILGSRSMLARLLRIALGVSTVEDEHYVLDLLSPVSTSLVRARRKVGYALRSRRSGVAAASGGSA